MTTIHTQQPTLPYVYQVYPGKTQASVPLLARHSQLMNVAVQQIASTASAPRLNLARLARHHSHDPACED
jgi:hypothetical protein